MKEEIKRADIEWKVAEKVSKYFGEIRGGIPMAAEQMQVILRVVSGLGHKVGSFLDLGCGNGVASGVVLLRYPESKGLLVDFNDEILKVAKKQLEEYGDRLSFVNEDLADPAWTKSAIKHAPFDIVISSFMVHHLFDGRKKELIEEVFGMLSPGGLFLLLEQVTPASKWQGDLALKYFQRSVIEFNRARGQEKTDEEAWELVREISREGNILSPVEDYLGWLNSAGFTDVDCYFRIFEGALIGGRKPFNHGKV